MSHTFSADATITGYVPDEATVNEIRDWFDAYDRATAAGDSEAMAKVAYFPLNLVSDNGSDGVAQRSDRASFVGLMDGQDTAVTSIDSTRTALFLSACLVVVFSRSVITTDHGDHPMRYADILLKTAGQWQFQTMVQPGWADGMTADEG